MVDHWLGKLTFPGIHNVHASLEVRDHERYTDLRHQLWWKVSLAKFKTLDGETGLERRLFACSCKKNALAFTPSTCPDCGRRRKKAGRLTIHAKRLKLYLTDLMFATDACSDLEVVVLERIATFLRRYCYLGISRSPKRINPYRFPGLLLNPMAEGEFFRFVAVGPEAIREIIDQARIVSVPSCVSVNGNKYTKRSAVNALNKEWQSFQSYQGEIRLRENPFYHLLYATLVIYRMREREVRANPPALRRLALHPLLDPAAAEGKGLYKIEIRPHGCYGHFSKFARKVGANIIRHWGIPKKAQRWRFVKHPNKNLCTIVDECLLRLIGSHVTSFAEFLSDATPFVSGLDV